jgi:hypothetical protein
MKNSIYILKIAIESTKKELDSLEKITDKNHMVKSVIKNENEKIKEYQLAINILQKEISCRNCINYNNGYCNLFKINVSINAKWCKSYEL